MSDLPYNPETNITMLSPREKWMLYTRDHFGFLEGPTAGLGPRQIHKAKSYYSTAHWEGGTYNSGKDYGGFRSVTRILTAQPDEKRMAKIYELIDAAWAAIEWKISKKTFKVWCARMDVILPTLKAMRPTES